jgi:AraC family transcriptional regulator
MSPKTGASRGSDSIQFRSRLKCRTTPYPGLRAFGAKVKPSCDPLKLIGHVRQRMSDRPLGERKRIVWNRRPAQRAVKRVIAMITHSLLSLPGIANPSSGGAPTPRQAPNQRQTNFEQFESPSDFATGSDLFQATVQISPIRSVKRHSTGWHGLVAESIYTPVGSTTEFRFDAPVHLLVIYDEGARCEGETSIDGVTPSRLRNFADKLTFVPADHAYYERHETSTATRLTFLYLDPAKLQNSDNLDATYAPRLFFEDSVLWETATKLKSAIESGKAGGMFYSEALAQVLAHKLLRTKENLAPSPVSRGGLASWQMRAVTGYVEEHLGEHISLDMLAGLTRLSQHHFCRAFKQSFGIPPLQYHVQRRIERAKFLLAHRANSVTDVALILGSDLLT